MTLFRLSTFLLLVACGQKSGTTEKAAVAASEENAQERLRVKLGSEYEQGWNLRTVQSATQSPGKPKVFRVTLLSGNNYRFLATADENAQDIALTVVDKNMVPITRDESGGVEAEISFKAEESGHIYLATAIQSLKSSAKESALAVGVLYQ